MTSQSSSTLGLIASLLLTSCAPAQKHMTAAQAPKAAAPVPLAPAAQCTLKLARAEEQHPTMKPGDEKACDMQCATGDQSSCVALGLLHFQGTLLAKDPEHAATLFESACTAGFAPGCTHLGELAAAGVGVPSDVPRALALFRKACEADEALGCYNLGALFDNNRSMGKDPTDAFARACALGAPDACAKAPKPPAAGTKKR